MKTIVFGSGFRSAGASAWTPERFYVLIQFDDTFTVDPDQPRSVYWSLTREALERLVQIRQWTYYFIYEVANPVPLDLAPSWREVGIEKLNDPRYGDRGRNRAIWEQVIRCMETIHARYDTLGELADAGEAALRDLGFEDDVINVVDGILAKFNLELKADTAPEAA